ncbi:MAG: acyl carrier protein [Planctomycetes bacterium]|nr:acyl carrier protein [Planctomycetota bacterium]
MPDEKTLDAAIKEMIVERLFLSQKGVSPKDIPNDANLMKTLEIDSVSVLEIVVGLEELYGISFEDEEFKIEVFESVNTIVDFVRKKLDKKG